MTNADVLLQSGELLELIARLAAKRWLREQTQKELGAVDAGFPIDVHTAPSIPSDADSRARA